jgi:hypothetical protein
MAVTDRLNKQPGTTKDKKKLAGRGSPGQLRRKWYEPLRGDGVSLISSSMEYIYALTIPNYLINTTIGYSIIINLSSCMDHAFWFKNLYPRLKPAMNLVREYLIRYPTDPFAEESRILVSLKFFLQSLWQSSEHFHRLYC